MDRGRFLVFIIGVYVWPLFASADIVITKVMYDPLGSDTGHEWIELVNAGTSSVRLSELRLHVSGANHKIVPLSGDGMLAPQAHAAIVQDQNAFAKDDSSFAGAIFHSSFSLPNKNGEVALIDKSGIMIASKSYVAPSPVPLVPKQKVAKTKKMPSKNIRSSGLLAPSAADNQGASMDAVTPPQAAATGEAGASSTSLWWIGTIALAYAAGVATFASRRVAKREWDISEEKGN